ncbi:hypothetical protein ARMGADRAFT_814569 [Armillaria gallica]|uniref:Uncharacterized protein n=1 Tax=Armillaria gallica TaxID=47427 RepID=A0A2H3CWK7_ARMGA|nr:hypothetical protein ARMGADRAFT_814569 [Armillaria gallica]
MASLDYSGNRPHRYIPPFWLSLEYNCHGAFERATRIARLLPPDNQSLLILASTTIWECRLGLTATQVTLSQSKCRLPSDSWHHRT